MRRNLHSRLFIPVLIVASLALSVHAANKNLATGTSVGTFTLDGKKTKLAYAGAFVDQKDARKSTILIISDRKLPASSWKSESDIMRTWADRKFVGVAFWIDRNGDDFRTEYYDGKQSNSTSGILKLKLDAASGRDLSGSAIGDATADMVSHPMKLDVRFHANR